ncbi:MAG: histidine kinase dimerization/phosphoacceptor domain -containing protein [Balneolaceae bacterium]|nr:histidine kinase dimerization/phosphoacceptor domain -containing protein [Balneolaceae bacterium]
MKTLSLSDNYGLKIALTYLVVSALWIIFSDKILSSIITNESFLLQFQTYKGLFFVIVTALLLYVLIRGTTSSLVKSRKRMEEALKEKQILLGELHHRVKNNLAIIAGLIELQSENLTGEKREVLKSTQYRIYTLADIQELLYREENLTKVPFHDHLNQLVRTLRNHQNTSIDTDIDLVNLSINQAVPLSLLLNEVVSQIRQGIPDQDFTMNIILKLKENREVNLVLQLEHASRDTLNRIRGINRHLEATLISIYTKQLKGSSGWTTNNGEITFSIRFEQSERTGSSSSLEHSGIANN